MSWSMQAAKHHKLSFMPRGLNRREAAYYVGVSPSFFDILVKDGRMPTPKKVNSRVLSDSVTLDEAFDALPDMESKTVNPWDEGE